MNGGVGASGGGGGGGGGGAIGSIIGNALLGYLSHKKGEERYGEIAGKGAELADPFAKQRKYYQEMLNQIYGKPEDYGKEDEENQKAQDEKESNTLMGLLNNLIGNVGLAGKLGSEDSKGQTPGLFSLLGGL